MALLNNDLLVIQRISDQKHYKVTVEDFEAYIESTSSVTFKGKVDLTSAPSGDAASPNNGDLYINDTSGASNAGWTGITAATPVEPGDRILWDSDPGEWVLISDAGDPGGQVDTIVGQTPIIVDDSSVGSATAPIISIIDATDPGDKGAVVIASDTDVANGTTGVVVTADQLKDTNDAIAAGGGGTVMNVTGSDPIEVANGTVNPVVSIKDAAEDQKGAVRLATDAEAAAGLLGTVAVTPAQLVANVPDISNEVGLAEGGSGIVAGALLVDDTDVSAMTVGVAEKTFAPYDFTALDAA